MPFTLQGKRAVCAFVLAASMLGATAVSASADRTPAGPPPPTLKGERLIGPATLSSINCNPSGTSSFNFTVSGPAVGPYSGTFLEFGSATIGPQTILNIDEPSLGPVERLSIVFAINSPSGRVFGSKSLQTPFTGQCQDSANTVSFQGFIRDAAGIDSYSARIRTAAGTFSDQGTARVNVADETDFGSFGQEVFTSQQLTTTPDGGDGGDGGDGN
jgi:hypothetical protein